MRPKYQVICITAAGCIYVLDLEAMPIEINILIYANKYANQHSFGVLGNKRIGLQLWCFNGADALMKEDKEPQNADEMRSLGIPNANGNLWLCKLF